MDLKISSEQFGGLKKQRELSPIIHSHPALHSLAPCSRPNLTMCGCQSGWPAHPLRIAIILPSIISTSGQLSLNTIAIFHIVTCFYPARYANSLVALAVYYSPISSFASIASIYVSYSYSYFLGDSVAPYPRRPDLDSTSETG